MPDLTGRRVMRWINHALFLLRGADERQSRLFFRALAQQTWFLSKRWQAATPGLPRFEALAGLVQAGLALEGLEQMADPALRALAGECDRQVDDQGGIPTRNPEELLEVFTLLSWTSAALNDLGRGTPAAQANAIKRIAPTLRSLRHADGALARYHGGGRGVEGRLEQALAQSGVKHKAATELPMGYARLSAARTTVVVDASVPPAGAASMNAHASTLAFELTSGRRPLIVNCGSGASFGLELATCWAGRRHRIPRCVWTGIPARGWPSLATAEKVRRWWMRRRTCRSNLRTPSKASGSWQAMTATPKYLV